MRRTDQLPARVLLVGCLVILSTPILAQDTIRRIGFPPLQATIKRMTPLEVVVDFAGQEQKIPVNEIQSIVFQGEPAALNTVRSYAAVGRYQDALDILNDPKKIPPEDLDRPILKQEVEFYKGYCMAKLALAGSADLQEAGKALVNFVQNYSGSYHYLEASELIGHLLVAAGKYKEAEAYYKPVAQTPWPDYQIRAGVALGRLALAQNRIDDAEKAFDKVLAISASGPQAELYRQEAQLGKARCLAEKGKIPEARKIVEDLLAVADPEHQELHARAYNTLGTIERKAGRIKEALLAFLHVDVLYSANGEQHAEALANLVELWNQLHKPERATQARQLLETRYKNSIWAKKLAGS
ncbi:MAG: tetratricopeptide repeat protein [Thermoguttaceae bacterium]|nr:tetratricopeptide repeat protein [Thermoguttaceae bacterium]MDW8038673.1 tetratricopeptide repeat protein [Thermoguttaceae bacterium]